jgi:hypothetical protein
MQQMITRTATVMAWISPHTTLSESTVTIESSKTTSLHNLRLQSQYIAMLCILHASNVKMSKSIHCGEAFLSIWADKIIIVKSLWPWPLTQSPNNLKGSSSSHKQPQYQICWLLTKAFLSNWADKLFLVKVPVTLTFDLVTSKSIGVTKWSWQISMPNMKIVGQRILKLLGVQAFWSQGPCDLDLWPGALKIKSGHLLVVTNLHAE